MSDWVIRAISDRCSVVVAYILNCTVHAFSSRTTHLHSWLFAQQCLSLCWHIIKEEQKRGKPKGSRTKSDICKVCSSTRRPKSVEPQEKGTREAKLTRSKSASSVPAATVAYTSVSENVQWARRDTVYLIGIGLHSFWYSKLPKTTDVLRRHYQLKLDGVELKVAYRTVVKWGVQDVIVGVVFDTTASNTWKWLVCRHHLYELHIKHLTEAVKGNTKDPGVSIFRRLEQLVKFNNQTSEESLQRCALEVWPRPIR